MNRRTLLRAAAGSAVVSSSMVSGCLGVVGDDSSCDASDDGFRWCYGIGGRLDAVQDGTVFARERSAGEKPWYERRLQSEPVANGEAVALDADTGEVQWTYGETGRLDSYTELAVADGVYFGHCGDDDCTELHAVDRDGAERWTREMRVGSRRPIVSEGAVYVHARPLRALDAATGDVRWTYPTDSDESASLLLADDDDVFVENGSAIVGLDPVDGSERWQYDLGDQRVLKSSLEDGILYVVTPNWVAAVADGTEQWRWAFDAEVDRETEIVGTASDHLFLFTTDGSREYQLHAFDVDTGDRAWVSDPIEHPNPEHEPTVDVHGDVAYVGAARLRALDAATGSERWSVALDAGPIQSVTVDDADSAGDHEVFAQIDGHLLASFSPDGQRTWDESVPGRIWNYLVEESVFVATDEGIYALERLEES